MTFIYVFLSVVFLLLLYLVFLSSGKKDNLFSQHIDLSVTKGISSVKDELNKNNIAQVEKIGEIKKSINDELHRFKSEVTGKSDEQIQEMKDSLRDNFQKLQEQVEKRLEEINIKVETKLSKGFEDTNKTFQNISERLVKIDEAQKKIESLSKDVVSLQDILSDKKTRGTFGEIQLHQILSSVFGEKNDAVYELQKDILDFLGKKIGRVDAIIKLPHPTGILPIDSKFPLENYRKMYDNSLSDAERDEARKKFKHDLKTRIDETSKYVVDGITAQYAIMFLTAEAVFAEIHGYHSTAIEYAHQKNVYIASPTTLFAMMNTVQAVLRDQERSKLAEQIRKNLEELSVEFRRYKERWEKLAGHIDQVNQDVEDIFITTKKISDRFEKIHRAEIPSEEKKLFWRKNNL